MRRYTARLGAAALFLSLADAGSAALADEWMPSDSGQEGLSAITYRGEDMLPGEQATFFFTGTQTETVQGADGYYWPTDVSTILFQIVLTSGDEPITGFEGVTLRQELQGEDIETFHSVVDPGDPNESWRPACGGYRLGALPDGSEATCANLCFRSYDDLAAQQKAVACDGGEARWIAIFAAGTLRRTQKIPPAGPDASEARKMMDAIQKMNEAFREEFGSGLGLDEITAAANYLVVEVKWKGVTSVYFQIDDAFRKAIWDPQ